MPFSAEDSSYTLYDGAAISYAKTSTPTGMPFPHYHRDYELFFLVEGGRKFFCSNTICSLSSKTAMLIEPNEHHQSTVNLNTTMERYALYVSPKLMDLILKENKEFCTLKSVMKFTINDDSFAEIIAHIKKIQKEFEEKSIYSKNSVKNHITAIMIILLRSIQNPQNNDTPFEKSDIRLQAPIDYIIKNYAAHITLEQCAEIAYMSPSHFSRQFKTITGMNFKEYLNKVRIEKACQTLKNEKVKNMTLLAQSLGFSSGSYFTYVFRMQTGISPTEYQKLQFQLNGILK